MPLASGIALFKQSDYSTISDFEVAINNWLAGYAVSTHVRDIKILTKKKDLIVMIIYDYEKS